MTGSEIKPGTEQASGRAIAALVLGIATYANPLMALTSIPAWVLGRMELKAIDAGLAPAAGRRAALIGMWLGIVGTVAFALLLLGLILPVFAGSVQSS